MAQAFDERTLEVGGNPVAVASAVGLNPLINQALFSVSESGTLVFLCGHRRPVGARLGEPDRPADREGGSRQACSTACRCRPMRRVSSMITPIRARAAIDLWRLDFARGEPSGSRSIRRTTCFRSGRQMAPASRSPRFASFHRSCTS